MHLKLYCIEKEGKKILIIPNYLIVVVNFSEEEFNFTVIGFTGTVKST